MENPSLDFILYNSIIFLQCKWAYWWCLYFTMPIFCFGDESIVLARDARDTKVQGWSSRCLPHLSIKIERNCKNRFNLRSPFAFITSRRRDGFVWMSTIREGVFVIVQSFPTPNVTTFLLTHLSLALLIYKGWRGKSSNTFFFI